MFKKNCKYVKFLIKKEIEKINKKQKKTTNYREKSKNQNYRFRFQKLSF